MSQWAHEPMESWAPCAHCPMVKSTIRAQLINNGSLGSYAQKPTGHTAPRPKQFERVQIVSPFPQKGTNMLTGLTKQRIINSFKANPQMPMVIKNGSPINGPTGPIYTSG